MARSVYVQRSGAAITCFSDAHRLAVYTQVAPRLDDDLRTVARIEYEAAFQLHAVPPITPEFQAERAALQRMHRFVTAPSA